MYLSPAVLLPTGFAIGYGEPVWPFLAAGAITGGVAAAVTFATRGDHRLGIREGFLVVALTWLAAAAFGALPYILSGDPQLDRPIDAFFEGMSGFSTTGGSVVANVEELDRSLAIWRQFTQWLGGIGIIVLALAVLPRLRVGGRQLLEHEMPGPEIETLSTRIRDTARRVWVLYIALTAVLFAILLTFGATGIDDRMSPYQSFAHALTTIPTAGFSTRADSIESFAAATQWVLVLFMILGGFNFALMYRTLVQAPAIGAPARRRGPLVRGAARARLADRRHRDLDRGRACPRGRHPRRRLHSRLDDDDDRLLGRRLQHLADARADDDRRADVRRRLGRVDDRVGQGRPASAARQDPPARDRPDAAPRDRPPRATESPCRGRTDVAGGLLVHPALHRHLHHRRRPARDRRRADRTSAVPVRRRLGLGEHARECRPRFRHRRPARIVRAVQRLLDAG